MVVHTAAIQHPIGFQLYSKANKSNETVEFKMQNCCYLQLVLSFEKKIHQIYQTEY